MAKMRGVFQCVEEKMAGMARQLRIEYPGAIYHVMARGDRRGRFVNLLVRMR